LATRLLGSLAMVLLFRFFAEESEVGVAISLHDGTMEWLAFPRCGASWLYFSVSEFGDLGSLRALAMTRSTWWGHLRVGLSLVRYWTDHSVRGLGVGDPCECQALYSLRASPRVFPCGHCESPCCDLCVGLAAADSRGRPSSWTCHDCLDEDVPTVPQARLSFIWDLDERMRRMFMDYDIEFFYGIRALSGEEVVDERRVPVGLGRGRWSRLRGDWDLVYSMTGGRVQRLVRGTRFVDAASATRLSWSYLLSRAEARGATRASPLWFTVVLRGLH
jgi:hypothetical protein